MPDEAEDDEEIVSKLISLEEYYNNNESRDHIITNSTIIPVIICQTWYTSPTIVRSLENISQKNDRYNKKLLGAMESKNDMVWITLQDRQSKWKKGKFQRRMEMGQT